MIIATQSSMTVLGSCQHLQKGDSRLNMGWDIRLLHCMTSIVAVSGLQYRRGDCHDGVPELWSTWQPDTTADMRSRSITSHHPQYLQPHSEHYCLDTLQNLQCRYVDKWQLTGTICYASVLDLWRVQLYLIVPSYRLVAFHRSYCS